MRPSTASGRADAIVGAADDPARIDGCDYSAARICAGGARQRSSNRRARADRRDRRAFT